MGTYRDLQDRITLDYLNRTNLGDAVKRAIKNAIKHYEVRRFWFNETSTALTTTASQSFLDMPADLFKLDMLEITYSGATTALLEEPFSVIRAMNATSATSVPTHFATRGSHFEFALIPNAAYPITVQYMQTLTPLVGDLDTNAWTTEAENLICHAATLDILISVLHVADDTRVQRHSSMLAMAWTELCLRNEARQVRRLRATRF